MSSTPAHAHRQLRLPSRRRAKHVHTFAFFHSPDEESRVLSGLFSDAFERGESACELIHPDLLEHPDEPIGESLNGFPVVQVGRVLDDRLQSVRSGRTVTAVFGEGEEQVELGALGAARP